MRLRYWIKTGLQTFLWVVGACALYSFLMFIQMDDFLQGALINLPIYLLLFGGMMLMGMNIGAYKFNLQLALSFGSTRNEAIVGLNLMRLIPTLLLTALVALLCSLTDATDVLTAAQAIPVGLGVYLTCGALGSVVGVVFTKYGKIATVVTMIAFFLVAGGAGFLAGFSGDERFLAWVTFDGNLPWLILAMGLFIYAIASIPEQRTVWKCNVKM